MRYEMAAADAAGVTQAVTQPLEKVLSSTSLMLFKALHTSAVEVAAARGYHVNTSQVSFFCPVEAVALALGCHRVTVWRAARELRAAGLVDVRGHFCTYRGRTRLDGSVWAVRLRPVGGCKARLGYDDLKKSYRDLGADVAAGRTCWAARATVKTNPSRAGVNLDYIRRWSLPATNPAPVTVDRCARSRRDLEALLDVKHAARGERGAAVDLAAQALAQALADRGGLNFYRRLLWQLLRRADAGGEDYSYQVYLAAQRAAVDAQEGFSRRAGALFVSRLKRAGWWSELWAAPPSRVAGRLAA